MRRKLTFKSAVTVILAALFFAIASCSDPFYIAVMSVEGVPETGEAGTPLILTGNVRPAFASNNNIIWSVINAGTTGASIRGNILNTAASGTVKIRAKIANGTAEGKDYIQDFEIIFNEGGGDANVDYITSASINVWSPAKGGIPNPGADSGGEIVNYTIGEVSWSPNDDPFKGETAYTATVTLTADEGYVFSNIVNAKVNGNNAAVKENTGTTVTISYTFEKTLGKIITEITISSPPTKMTYISGEALNLSGLVVTLIFDEGSPENVAYSNFGAYDITTVPAHDTPLTSAHNGQPITVNASGRSENTTSYLKVIEPITAAAVTVTPPAKNAVPNTAATGSGHFSVGAVSWSPSDNPFKSDTAYTATVTLTANTDYTFTGLSSATINGSGASINNNTGTTVTLSYTFAKTLVKEITGITVKSQPSKLVYTNGEELDLSGLAVILTFDSGSPEEVAYSNFTSYNITTSPTQGTTLTLAHNGTFVTITTDNGKTANNVNLTVNKAGASPVTFPTATAITYGEALSTSTLSGGSAGRGTFTWVNGTTVPSAGTHSYDVEFTPNDTGTYDYSDVPGWNGTKVVRTVSITVNKAPGSEVSVPTVSGSPTNNSITVGAVNLEKATGQSVQYAILEVNNGSPTAWQNGTTFTGLNAGTTYYVYARSVSNDNYNTGAHSVSAGIKTSALPNEARIGSTEYATLSLAISEADNGSVSAPTEIVVLRNITAVQDGTNDYVYNINNGKNIKLIVESGKNITITAAAGNIILFQVIKGSSLTLGSTTGGGTLTLDGNKESATGYRKGVYVEGSIFNMYNDVTITGFNNNSHSPSSGGGVGLTSNSTFIMNGGTISGNTSYDGGGVSVTASTFTMSGGTISSNTSLGNGGGIYILSLGGDAAFTMNGGIISGNTSIDGGGVYLEQYNSQRTATFTMRGGTIYGTDETVTSLQNKAPDGAALYNNGGTANYSGTYGGGKYTLDDKIPTSDKTLPGQPRFITSIKGIDLVSIPAGTFLMGSPVSETGRQNNEGPQHSVTLTKSFYMGKYQVTQDQYQAVMSTNPSYFTSALVGESGTPGKLPVEKVSWYEAIIFCNKLSLTEGLEPVYTIKSSVYPTDWGTIPTGYSDPNFDIWNLVEMDKNKNGYRLPTEAEWEYACRAGTTTAYNTGNTITDDIGWYLDNSGEQTHQVGLKPANAFGLFDMHGNVFEWCWDCFTSNYYNNSPVNDPTGPWSPYDRVARGGDVWFEAGMARSAYRNSYSPHNSYPDNGFRVVRTIQ